MTTALFPNCVLDFPLAITNWPRKNKTLAITCEAVMGDLADEFPTAQTPENTADLPKVAPEDFETLYTWFLS